MTEEDNDTLKMMETYGGGFVKALAAAARRADPDNLARIKAGWPEYWGRYSAMVRPPIGYAGNFAHKSVDEAMNDRCRNNPNDREASDWVYRNLK